ncbi:MAG TPA: hypothetical protein VF365_10625 [Candidatus Limnocylindria bacterium]
MQRLDRRIAVLALALSVAATGIGSLALVTDVLTVTNDHSGTVITVDLQANGAQSVSAEFAWTTSGEIQAQELLVSNAGSAQIRYAMRSTVTGSGALPSGLAAALYVVDGTDPCDPSIFDFLSPLTASQFLDFFQFGDPATGEDTGDRTLAAGASERLCVLMQAKPDVSLEGDAQHVMTFSAESTAP